MESVHDPSHAHSRELAQSGRNRNWPLRPTMPWNSKNAGYQDSAPRESRLEPPHKSRPGKDQLEVRPKSCPPEIRLHKESLQAVKELVRSSVRKKPGLTTGRNTD